MKEVLITFLLPIGLTLVLLAWAVVMVWRQRQVNGRLRLVLVTALLVLYLASTPLVGRALGQGLFNAISARSLDDPSQAGAIVVLTGQMVNAGPVGWLPTRDSYQRLAVAYELQRMVNLRMPVIVSGGHTHGVQAPSEAAVLAGFFASNRTEITPTELEETSTDTYESALQLAPELAKREARNIFLVTSDTHMLRALATYRARGVDAIPFPALSLPGPLGMDAFVPSLDGLRLTYAALYEYIGLAAYLLTGKIGFSDIFYEVPQQVEQG